ncbi:MAG: hypothetical protein AAF938_27825, partial [Myxococcota bacterium]
LGAVAVGAYVGLQPEASENDALGLDFEGTAPADGDAPSPVERAAEPNADGLPAADVENDPPEARAAGEALELPAELPAGEAPPEESVAPAAEPRRRVRRGRRRGRAPMAQAAVMAPVAAMEAPVQMSMEAAMRPAVMSRLGQGAARLEDF